MHDGLWCASTGSHPAPSQKLLPVITAAKEPHVTHRPSLCLFTTAACQGVRCATKVIATLPCTTITTKLTMQLLRCFALGLMRRVATVGVHQFCMAWGLVILARDILRVLCRELPLLQHTSTQAMGRGSVVVYFSDYAWYGWLCLNFPEDHHVGDKWKGLSDI